MEGKYRYFPYVPLPPYMHRVSHYIPHQTGTLLKIEGTILRHYNHLKSIVYFILYSQLVQSMDLSKCITTLLWNHTQYFHCSQNSPGSAYTSLLLFRHIFYGDGKEQVNMCRVQRALDGSENIVAQPFIVTSDCFFFPWP